MALLIRRTSAIIVALLILTTCSEQTRAAGDASATIQVQFENFNAKVVPLHEGVSFFLDFDRQIKTLPAELAGLEFTRRGIGKTTDVTIKVPANVTVYLLVAKDDERKKQNMDLAAQGWTSLKANVVIASPTYPRWAVYKQAFTKATTVTVAGGIPDSGVDVAAKKIDLAAGANDKKDSDRPEKNSDHTAKDKDSTIQPESTVNTTPITGPTTRPALAQTSIKALEVYTQDSGMMLGQTSEVVLTLTRGTGPKLTNVRFVTAVGDQMRSTRDEALRYLHLTYPNWDVDDAEITFEDKYVPHDGGSIGAAVGTMILSTIQGFKIDPDVAITGDISANGKVRAIGGVSAKLHGAIASKCTLVAVPSENYDQLVDAVVYSGPALVTDVQVIGISNLDDAVAAVRVDRELKLRQAIALFAELQAMIKGKPDYLKTKNAQDNLAAVLAFEPQHLSAKILLTIAQGKQPHTLSATASNYYTAVAIQPMLAILKERSQSGGARQVPSSAVRAGLFDLKKLRPMADPNIRPLIDAWAGFIDAWSDLQDGQASSQRLESKRQALLDEMAKQRANADMMQKMLKEGI